ncbi:hypothetical protein [Vibrio albus]|uniref:hypothetical protein n=1 Tax=Vibrio albus TaxID=2200953 RepID=UPI001C627713|nr:hypothetical protein [Vibrio albus]
MDEKSLAIGMNNDTTYTYTDSERSVSPLSLYSEYQRLEIELREPDGMPTSHWHGQIEVNVPFDGDVEYVINGETIRLKQGHINYFLGLCSSSAEQYGRVPAYGDF